MQQNLSEHDTRRDWSLYMPLRVSWHRAARGL